MLWHCLACGVFYDKHLAVCTSCRRDGQVAPYAHSQQADRGEAPAMRNAHVPEHKGEDLVWSLGVPAFLGLGTTQFASLMSGRPSSGKSIWLPILLLDRSPLMARKGVG
jgi:hypothetical protein